MIGPINVDERNLSGPTVARLAGITDSTLRQWNKRGLTTRPGGPNAWPTYSLRDAVRYTTIADLGRAGVDLTLASQIAASLKVGPLTRVLRFSPLTESAVSLSVDAGAILRRVAVALRAASATDA